MANIFLTAQNIDIYAGDGRDLFSRTGSTSIEQVARAGAQGVILGHPEAGDSPDVVKQKLRTVIDRSANLPPTFVHKMTVMVGESWENYQNHTAEEIADITAKQIVDILAGVSAQLLTNYVVGYDPKWSSRGSGHDDVPAADPAFIFVVAERVRAALGTDMPFIYGGKSTPERTLELLANDGISGLILGAACNTVQKTKEIADAMQQVRPTERKILHANFKAFNLSDSYEDYVEFLRGLDDSFTVYISPCDADLRLVAEVLARTA